MEAACDGNCQCSTCHVFIPEAGDRARLGMPDCIKEFELDMLEIAAEYEAINRQAMIGNETGCMMYRIECIALTNVDKCSQHIDNY